MDGILHLLSQYGYLIIFLGVMAESTGVPLPGETILIYAGILVQRGGLDLTYTIAFGILGAMVGDQIGYLAGRFGGRSFILRWGRYLFITSERLERAEKFFARHGGKAVFFARFFSGLRIFGALVAGISRMRWRTFFVFNALGGAVWATAAVLVGYFLGSSLGVVEQWTGRASILLVALAVIGLSLYLAYRWAVRHPEWIQRSFERIGGQYVYSFLDSPAGLWLKRRFSPNGVLGLSLTLGLVFTGLFSWALGGVVQDVVARDPLVRADLAILRFFHSHGEPYLTACVNVFEAVFTPELVSLLAVVAGVAFLFASRGMDRSSGFETRLSGIVLLVTASGALVLSELLKLLFQRPRPPASLQLVHEAGYGFPSTHAAVVVAVGAAVWYLSGFQPLSRLGRSWRARARIGLSVVVIALLVGFGRVYTGTHYPSDVLAGWALGGVWASVCLTAAEIFGRLQNEEIGERDG